MINSKDFTQEEINEYFLFGSPKVSHVIHEYNEAGEVPKSLKSHRPTKLTPDMLLHIHQCISHNAHTRLEQIGFKSIFPFEFTYNIIKICVKLFNLTKKLSN